MFGGGSLSGTPPNRLHKEPRRTGCRCTYGKVSRLEFGRKCPSRHANGSNVGSKQRPRDGDRLGHYVATWRLDTPIFDRCQMSEARQEEESACQRSRY